MSGRVAVCPRCLVDDGSVVPLVGDMKVTVPVIFKVRESGYDVGVTETWVDGEDSLNLVGTITEQVNGVALYYSDVDGVCCRECDFADLAGNLDPRIFIPEDTYVDTKKWMVSLEDDDRGVWRSFMRHVPSGEVYVLEYDASFDSIVGIAGPSQCRELGVLALINAKLSTEDVLSLPWANGEEWQSLTFTGDAIPPQELQ